MKCPVCGNEIEENAQFCSNCGTAVIRETSFYEEQKSSEQSAYESFQQNTGESAGTAYEEKKEEPKSEASQPKENVTVLPEAYRPLSMWAYFGYDVLFAIPLIGFICILIFAFGTEKNKNLISFAQSRFIWLIARIILFTFASAVAITYFILN